jgi:hypothetical protein
MVWKRRNLWGWFMTYCLPWLITQVCFSSPLLLFEKIRYQSLIH